MTPEKTASKLKMQTGIEAKIRAGKLVIKEKLTQEKFDAIVHFCHVYHLTYEMKGNYQFIIS